MAEPLHVSLFGEDNGHELAGRAVLRHIERELGIRCFVRVASSTGGYGRALTELAGFVRHIRTLRDPLPDVLVVLIDANSEGWGPRLRNVREILSGCVVPHRAIGVPVPHVERWCFADPVAFERVVGSIPYDVVHSNVTADWKLLLRQAVVESGRAVISSPMEFAPDIFAEMDLRRAGQRDESLGKFVDELRASCRQAMST